MFRPQAYELQPRQVTAARGRSIIDATIRLPFTSGPAARLQRRCLLRSVMDAAIA